MRSYKFIEFGPFMPQMEHCISLLTRIPICERHQENNADFGDIRFSIIRSNFHPKLGGRGLLTTL